MARQSGLWVLNIQSITVKVASEALASKLFIHAHLIGNIWLIIDQMWTTIKRPCSVQQ